MKTEVEGNSEIAYFIGLIYVKPVTLPKKFYRVHFVLQASE